MTSSIFFFSSRTDVLTSSSFFAPVHTILPVPNNRKVMCEFGTLYTSPGNVSGAYSAFGSLNASLLRFSVKCRLPLATMFCIVISGFLLVVMPIFASSFSISLTPVSTISSLFAPVHTSLPLENTSAVIPICFSLSTNPGNCSGLYSVFTRLIAIFSNGMSTLNVTLATTFSTLTSSTMFYYPLYKAFINKMPFIKAFVRKLNDFLIIFLDLVNDFFGF